MNGKTLGGYPGSIEVEAYKSKPARIQGLEHKYTNVFVKNIPELMTKEKFDALFLPFGAIKQSKVCTNLDTGRSKEFGYVEFVSHESATAAVAALHDTKLDGEENALQIQRTLSRSELQLRKLQAFTSQPQQHNTQAYNINKYIFLFCFVDICSPSYSHSPTHTPFSLIMVPTTHRATAEDLMPMPLL